MVGNGPGGDILTPEEAFNPDSKIDDGKPDMGTARTSPYMHAACATHSTSADYAIAA